MRAQQKGINAKTWFYSQSFNSPAYRQHEDFQRRVFESAQIANLPEAVHIPHGRCFRHPEESTGNGMFDNPCRECEIANEN